MKKTIIFFALLFSASSFSQDVTNWQVGLNLNPFIFSRINSSFVYDKDKQNFPNGFGYGITIEKNWNDNWGFKTGFENTKQEEKYFFNEVSADNTKITSTFKYYKIPITIQYSYPISDKLFLTFNQGIQFSFLKYYKTVDESNYQIIISSSDYASYTSYQYPENNYEIHRDFSDFFHKKNLFGIIGSVGIKGFISDKFSYSTNLRYEYDLTNADNKPYYVDANFTPLKTTHNFRIGLEIGIQYHFKINDSFDSSPHKL